MPLRIHHGLSPGLLQCEANQLHEFLGGPSLIHVAGERSPALFVSVLLHGNETSGWDGLRTFLAAESSGRELIVFIGNTEAAAQGVRSLPGQADFNRIWRNGTGAGGATAAAVQSAIADVQLFASVDLHNNTGHNPYYSVLTELAPADLGLAYLFSDRAVYVEEPDTVLTRTFAGRCPAVALEVGPVGDPRCVTRVIDYLERLTELDQLPPANPEDFRLYRTRVRVHVADGIRISFEGDREPPEGADLVLTGGVEAVNFHELAPGTPFGAGAATNGDTQEAQTVAGLLRVLDTHHTDVTDRYLEIDEGRISLKVPVIPAMYTTDPDVIRQDCLCYFMERMET